MDWLEQADAANLDAKRRHDLEAYAARRDARKGGAPAGDLPLFDEVQRSTQDVPGLAEAFALTPAQIMGLPGFREAVSLWLTPPARESLTSWTALTAYLRRQAYGAGREAFRVLFLDKRNQLIADEVMGQGTVDHAPAYPREVARRALELDASFVVLTHNHPSGDPTPSSADVDMTKQIVAALAPLRIGVHDHVVTGRASVASLRALGLM